MKLCKKWRNLVSSEVTLKFYCTAEEKGGLNLLPQQQCDPNKNYPTRSTLKLKYEEFVFVKRGREC